MIKSLTTARWPLLAGLLLGAAGAVAAAPSPDAATLAGWHADLRLFADQLLKRHANAFHLISRARFGAEVAKLDRALPGLDRDSFWVGLDRIENAIGDGHTFLRLPADAPVLGIAFRHFNADWRVVAVAPGTGLTRALGLRLAEIDGMPLAKVEARIMSLTPADETWALRNYRAQALLANGLVLHGVGITPDDRSAHYTLLDDRGRRITIDARAGAWPPRAEWQGVVAVPPLSQRQQDQGLRCSVAAPATVYCNFTSYTNIRSEAAAALAQVDADHARRLIVDLRENNGGNFCEGLDDLVRPIAARAALNRDGGLFVLVGPQTFSAAMSNAAHFRQLTHAILVGAPIGEKPDSYQEIDDLLLPNTGWTARYSTRFYRFSDGGENLIRPDWSIATIWADYRAGRDRALDAVLALPPSAHPRARYRPNRAKPPAGVQYCTAPTS